MTVAGGLAAMVGWERERAERPAGLRTHMTVAIAAALFVAVGDVIVARYAGSEGIRIDTARLLTAIVTGVAFLGAGTIIVRKDQQGVTGLTTGASLLAVAGVGAASGLGAYVLATGATVLLFLVVGTIGWLARRADGDD